jgi:hypothetical protein
LLAESPWKAPYPSGHNKALAVDQSRYPTGGGGESLKEDFMPRYQLKLGCLFVDAWNVEKDCREPELPPQLRCAHIRDTRDGGPDDPADYVELNETAGFIARFIVMGLNTDNIIADILTSEYGSEWEGVAQTQVNEVRDKLLPYLEPLPNVGSPPPRRGRKRYNKPQVKTIGKHDRKYSLDFSPNWFATGWIKF